MPAPNQPTTLDTLTDSSLSSAQRLERILPLVYDQLRAIAQEALATERPGHTLQATAIVHEAYLKLVGDRQIPWQNKAHFYAAAAEAVRRILLDHARSRGRIKRGGGRAKLTLADVADLASADPDDVVTFDEAFQRLEEELPDAAKVVRLRFFGGLGVEQTAAALGLSASTVDRRWALARAWLFRWINERP